MDCMKKTPLNQKLPQEQENPQKAQEYQDKKVKDNAKVHDLSSLSSKSMTHRLNRDELSKLFNENNLAKFIDTFIAELNNNKIEILSYDFSSILKSKLENLKKEVTELKTINIPRFKDPEIRSAKIEMKTNILNDIENIMKEMSNTNFVTNDMIIWGNYS